jgi:hypothetical protein
VPADPIKAPARAAQKRYYLRHNFMPGMKRKEMRNTPAYILVKWEI